MSLAEVEAITQDLYVTPNRNYEEVQTWMVAFRADDPIILMCSINSKPHRGHGCSVGYPCFLDNSYMALLEAMSYHMEAVSSSKNSYMSEGLL